jgi:AI-2 transport protein TqsA
MNDNSKSNPEFEVVSAVSLAILATLAIAWLLHYTASVMIPFVLALFIVPIVSPLVDDLVLRRKFPPAAAILVALLVVAGVLAMLSLLVVDASQKIAKKAGDYGANVSVMLETLFPEESEEPASEAENDGAARNKADTPQSKQKKKQERRERHTQQLIHLVRTKISAAIADRLPSLAASTVGTVVGLISNVFFIIIFVIFLLAGRDARKLPDGIYIEIEQQIRSYIITKVVLSAATGILVWLSLEAIGLPLASVFGMLAFLFNFIPSIGSVIATLLPLPIAFVEFYNPGNPELHSTVSIFLVLLIPGTVQMAIGNGLEPKIMGEGLKLHPVTILLALSFWGFIWGPVGMLLATPITAIMRIILSRFEMGRPVADLMAGILPKVSASPTNEPA